MSMDTAEHIAATKMFIDENPSTISPTRTARVATGTGGFRDGASVSLADITCRRVGQNQKSAVMERTTTEGALVIPNGVFICLPDADLKRGDTFEFGNELVEVLHVSTLPPWRLQAETFHRGK